MTAYDINGIAKNVCEKTMAKKIADTEWDVLRTEYVSSNITLRELADKHGCSEDAVEKKAQREGWSDARRKLSAEVLAKADAELAESRAKELVKFNDEDLKVAKALRAQIAKHINEAMQSNVPLSTHDIKRLTSAAVDAQKSGRLALGVSTSNNEVTGANGQPLVPVLDVHFVD
jgi:hypothetical protein